MKEPSKVSQSHSKPPQIKLLCSFNGLIQNLSQHCEKLRYVGGETRLLALDRGVGISQLLSKISELQPRCSSFFIKYLLPEPECAGDRPLVSVDTDEDVRCMIEEHERLEAEGKGMRIRIFICDGRKSYPYSKEESPTKFPVWTGGLSGNPQCRIKNHRVGPTNIKNQRIVSYNVQNRQNNPNDLGNPRVHLLHGKPCHCALLRPKGGILKVGQVKPRHAHLGKSCHGIQVDPTKGIQPLLNVGISSGIMHSSDGGAPVDFFCAQCDVLGKEYGNLNIHRSCLHCCALSCGFSDCRCLSMRMGYYPNLHYNGNKIPIPCSGAIDIKEENACYSEVVNTEIQCRSTFNKPLFNDNQFTNVSEKDRAICITNPNRKGSPDSVVSDSPQTDVDPNSGLESIYNIKHPPHTWKVQMKGAHENGEVVAEQLRVGDDGINDNSLLDLSMRNLSLSSSLEVAPSVSSSSGLGGSLCGNPLPEHEVNSPSNQMDLRDKKLPSRSPPTEHFTEVGIHTSEALTNIAAQVSQREGKGHANDNEKETILFSSNLQEKIHLKGSVHSSKVVGGTGSSLPAVYNHLATPELQCIKNSDLEEIRELGTGTYGTVFYGKWRGCDVAIKRIKPSCFTGGELGDKERLVSDFWKEANLLGQLHHPNVLAFYGVVSDGPVTQLATITEYMVNGSLKQVLKKNDRTIDRRKRIIIAMDAAFGMEYLHEKNIVHFDLKSHNFLVNMRDPLRPICKIGDLGLSKVKQRNMVSGGVRGTIPWMAPELLTGKKCMVSEKVDVYSFGIVMWELLTGKEPYSDMRSEEIIAGVLKGDLRPEIPNWCEPQWRSLMERCWSTDPNSRPSFSMIAKELRVIAAGANIK